MAEYVVAGANRHPAAADWHGEVLAYGADRNIAIWNPQVCHFSSSYNRVWGCLYIVLFVCYSAAILRINIYVT